MTTGDPPGHVGRARLSRALRVTAGGAALFLLYSLGLPACPMATLTRCPCPGCGLTRATAALLHGHVAEAVTLHPLAPLIVPLLGGFLAYGAVQYVREGRWPALEGKGLMRAVAAGLALWALLIGVWIARFFGAFGGPVAV